MPRRLKPSSRTSRSQFPNRQKVTVIPPKALPSSTSSVRSPLVTPPTLTVTAKPIKTRPRRQSKSSSSSKGLSIFFYLLRLAIVGVGMGAIAGTVLPFFDPTHFFKALNLTFPTAQTQEVPKKIETNASIVEKSTASVELTQEISALNTKFTAVAAKYPKLKPQAFFIDLDNGKYVNFNGETSIAAASTIKVPILVAFFQDVDAGKASLDELLIADKEVIATGSGDMQYLGVGKKYTALETAVKMIIISDNTATNMLIRRLGGKEVLNERFKSWGLTTTVINNPLPDLEGTNTTNPKDLTLLLARISQGELVSLKSRDRILEIMQQTKTRTLLPQGIEEDATISHKTGDIGSVLGDTGVVDIPNGKRYVGTVLTQRPHNDLAGRQLIQEMSRTAYQHFKWYLAKPIPTPSNSSLSPSPSASPSPTPSSSPSPKPVNSEQ